MMITQRTRPNSQDCRHRERITIRSASVQRLVCEECGHLSFICETDLTKKIRRDRFARTADGLQR